MQLELSGSCLARSACNSHEVMRNSNNDWEYLTKNYLTKDHVFMHHITCWHALAGTYRPVTYDKNKKETLQTLPDLAVFLYDFCKIFMNTNFTKHFQLTGCSNCFRFFFFFGTFLCFFFCCFIISIGTYLTCVPAVQTLFS